MKVLQLNRIFSSVLFFSLFRLEEPCDGCAAPYGFRHIMPLTIDTRTFAVRTKCLKKKLHGTATNMEALFCFFFVKNPNENKIKCFFIVKVNLGKVEKFLKGSLDIILSPSPSVKIQIETLLGVVNKLLKTKTLLTTMFCLYVSSKLSRP